MNAGRGASYACVLAGPVWTRPETRVGKQGETMSVQRLIIRGYAWTALVAMALVLIPGPVAAQTMGTPEKYTAFAVNMGGLTRAGASVVDLVVDRWSTDSERAELMTTLLEKGPSKLLSSLQKLRRVGYIRTPNSIGYDLHFAMKLPGEDGGERIILATDRYIGFWEARSQPRSIDYPFTLIEIRIGKDGEGEGKMSLATKIVVDKDDNTIVLENYDTQPVLLKSVRREPTTR
jgi:hypothetical protein